MTGLLAVLGATAALSALLSSLMTTYAVVRAAIGAVAATMLVWLILRPLRAAVRLTAAANFRFVIVAGIAAIAVDIERDQGIEC